MGRKYTRTETIAQIEEAAKDMSTFYTATCIRRTGTTYKADGAMVTTVPGTTQKSFLSICWNTTIYLSDSKNQTWELQNWLA